LKLTVWKVATYRFIFAFLLVEMENTTVSLLLDSLQASLVSLSADFISSIYSLPLLQRSLQKISYNPHRTKIKALHLVGISNFCTPSIIYSRYIRIMSTVCEKDATVMWIYTG
uniref:Uncharacterized protein n=1 Tax=Parascaris univalens TaxID=6257 RepID=A0A915C4D5_PARUN